MSSLVRFNPQSQSFVSNGQGGKFEAKAITRQGIVSNKLSEQPGPKVLSQIPTTTGKSVKIYY
ncbi:MAG: hypothetical protein HPY74_06000 [Firmicutes bacterium]|nr:hypothetical protein [Bacillota bacterium]